MSTKCTIYYQEGKESDPSLHVFWDMGGHRPAGYYIDLGCDMVRIEDPLKLADELNRVLTIHAATDSARSQKA